MSWGFEVAGNGGSTSQRSRPKAVPFVKVHLHTHLTVCKLGNYGRRNTRNDVRTKPARGHSLTETQNTILQC